MLQPHFPHKCWGFCKALWFLGAHILPYSRTNSPWVHPSLQSLNKRKSTWRSGNAFYSFFKSPKPTSPLKTAQIIDAHEMCGAQLCHHNFLKKAPREGLSWQVALPSQSSRAPAAGNHELWSEQTRSCTTSHPRPRQWRVPRRWRKGRHRALAVGWAGSPPCRPSSIQQMPMPQPVQWGGPLKYINITKCNGPEREKININYLGLKSCLPWQLLKKFNVVPAESQVLRSRGVNGLKYHLQPSLENNNSRVIWA